MADREKTEDEKLHIRTCGRSDDYEDDNHHPYEPTPYTVLRRASKSGMIGRKNHLIDYGAGKSRAAFFLHHACGCRVSGVEFQPEFFRAAQENLKTYIGDRRGIRFILQDAERYAVPSDADLFWFFNPFSVTILRSCLARITESYYECPRPLKLFFYYPSDEFAAFLMTCDDLVFYDEIDCRDLFPGNDPRERILVFTDPSSTDPEASYRNSGMSES